MKINTQNGPIHKPATSSELKGKKLASLKKVAKALDNWQKLSNDRMLSKNQRKRAKLQAKRLFRHKNQIISKQKIDAPQTGPSVMGKVWSFLGW